MDDVDGLAEICPLEPNAIYIVMATLDKLINDDNFNYVPIKKKHKKCYLCKEGYCKQIKVVDEGSEFKSYVIVHVPNN